MSVILVVEQDAGYANRIAGTLRTAGFEVEIVPNRDAAVAASSAKMPSLVIASGTLPGARDLLGQFAAANGGPGSIVALPVTIADDSAASGYGADDILPKPFSDQDLQEVVARRLRAKPLDTSKLDEVGDQLTSADIFGDVLAEVEAEAAGLGGRSTASSAPGARSVTGAPDDKSAIDRKLEQTLSGVMPSKLRRSEGGPRKPKRKQSVPSIDEIDDLLDKTLSSLELPSRPRRPRPSAPAATPPAAPAPAAAPPPSAAPPPPPGGQSAPPSTPPARPTPTATPPAPPSSRAVPPPVAPAPTPPAAAADASWEPEPPSFGPDPAPALSEPSAAPALPEIGSLEPPTFEPPPPLEDDVFALDPAVPELAVPAPEPAADAPDAADLTGTHTDFASAFAYEPPPRERTAGGVAPASETGAAATEREDDPRDTLDGVLQIRGDDVGPSTAEGRPFGDYRLLERVAIGGMAEVWRARRRGVEGFQKTVAIKKILSHLTGSSDFVTMFIDEAKLAAQLSHAHIIQIYDLGKVDDDFFIAMEYVEGKDLRTILSAARAERGVEGGKVPQGLALLIVAAVARALDYAHRKRDFENREMGLVHRDVSPQNVLIGYEGEIKLCDFGIVKAVAKASTTQMGALKGKLQYMSPEQAWGKEVDARSDIFSLGSVLFELLTGEKLFQGDSEIGVLDAVRDCRIRSVREIDPEISPEVEAIVFKALAKDPEERYQTGGELEADINRVLEDWKPSPSQRELARFMHELFPVAGPLVAADASPIAEAGVAEIPPAVGPTADASTDTSTDAAGDTSTDRPASDSAGRSKLPLMLGAIVLLLALAALAWFFLGTSSDAPETGPDTQPAALSTDGAGGETVPDPAAVAPAGASPDGAADAQEAGDPAAGDPAAGDPAAGDPAASDPAESGGQGAESADADPIQKLIDEEVQTQRERLERDFEAEKRKIEEEIERVRRESEAAEGDGG